MFTIYSAFHLWFSTTFLTEAKSINVHLMIFNKNDGVPSLFTLGFIFNETVFFIFGHVFFSRIYRHNLRNLKFGSTLINADDCYSDAICPACPKVHTVLYM